MSVWPILSSKRSPSPWFARPEHVQVDVTATSKSARLPQMCQIHGYLSKGMILMHQSSAGYRTTKKPAVWIAAQATKTLDIFCNKTNNLECFCFNHSRMRTTISAKHGRTRILCQNVRISMKVDMFDYIAQPCAGLQRHNAFNNAFRG